jgi:hypothetical protein
MRRILVIVAAVAAFTALVAPAASAGNWPESRLDAAASSVAGHPVQVWCESSWGDWVHAGDAESVDFAQILGFTAPSTSTAIFISPSLCETLHALLSFGPSKVGNYWGSLAVHVLVHESEHQAGHIDEGEADCAALAVDDSVAVQYFGYQTSEQQRYTVTVTHRTKRIVTVTQQSRYRTVPSEQLAEFHSFDHAWHAATSPAYQGGCS